MSKVTIIGAGLAGAEAAWQVAERGIDVELIEMRPHKKSPAHHTGLFAELVCSNSLRAAGLENAVGLLKEEMRHQNSLIIKVADATKVPAGGALAVDRESFSQIITDTLSQHPHVIVIHREATVVPDERPLIIASGPLTSPDLAKSLQKLTCEEDLYFYDAAAPIVMGDSLNYDIIFRASRYGKGDDDYLNCPMNKDEYEAFWQALTTAETTSVREFEKAVFFEGCMPVEVMAGRGIDTLRFGPVKPVGLIDPRTGTQPHAVIQLRQDDKAATLFNIVGFQTHLKWPEQKRVFSMIPGLEQAEFVRYGVMHRNTFINSPKLLDPTMQLKDQPGLFLAGQMTGVEGYVESAASGLIAGMNAARMVLGQELCVFPPETAHGGLIHYITTADPKHFQPMNINFGLLPPLKQRVKDKKIKNQMLVERALAVLERNC
jgi:methylenetetrahydrofolate--tRNA-(uracil-5-)-methyltransferase